MERDNFTEVLKHFLFLLSIPVTRKAITNELRIHPEYNSLAAISDVLNTWNVPNAAYQLTIDEILAADVEDPFIAFIANREFAVVSELNKTHAVIYNEKWHNHQLTIDEFKAIYSGSILLADKEPTSGEANYSTNRRQEIFDNLLTPTNALLLVGCSFGMLLFRSGYFRNISSLNIQLFWINVIGIIISGLLSLQTLYANKFVSPNFYKSRFMSGCSLILFSNAAKIFNVVQWAEVGLLYFVGSSIVLLLSGGNLGLIKILSVINLLSLLFTLYFIFLQWQILKKWCMLCLVVQVLLWLEFTLFYPLLTQGFFDTDLNAWASLFFAILLPVSIWRLIKPLFLAHQQLPALNDDLRKFKYSREIFQASQIPSNQSALVMEQDSIIVGDLDAENTLTVVIKPYGKASSEAYKGLVWLDKRKDIKLQIILKAPNNDPDYYVAVHMLSLAENKSREGIKRSLDDWFNIPEKDYDEWADKYPYYKVEQAKLKLHKNNQWCNFAQVTEMPTIFFNGRMLSQKYVTADLKYFL